MRTHMFWYWLGHPMAVSCLDTSELAPDPDASPDSGLDWRPRFDRLLAPLLQQDLGLPALASVDRVRVFFRAWDVPRSAHDDGDLRSTPRAMTPRPL